MSGAFGTAAAKQALLEDIATSGPTYTTWLTPEAFEADLGAVATTVELHPAFVRLLPVLGGYGQGDAKAFYQSAIDALPVGADAAAAVRRWFLFAWEEPTYGLALRLKDGPLLKPAEAIIGLVRTSLDEPVGKGAWRAARAGLVSAQEAAGLPTEHVDPILSMAWDLDQAPGAAGDVVNGWSGPIHWGAYADFPDALTEVEGQAVNAQMRLAHDAAVAELGEPKQGDPEFYQAYQKATEAYWAGQPEVAKLRARQQAQGAHAAAKVAAWRAVAQRGLVELLAAAPLPRVA